MLTPAENVASADTIDKAVSSVQSVSRKILARRKAAKERNSTVGVSHNTINRSTFE